MPKLRLPILDTLFGTKEQQPQDRPSLIVVGLGNPGSQYAETRHNVGFWCVDRLAREHSITLERRHKAALIGEGVIGGRSVVLAKPRTYVNRSGEAVSYLLTRYRVTPAELLIVYDEINLPPGKLRLRPRGSAGGHNGIKSVIEALGTQEFPRLRVGVGRPPDGADQIGHVLGAVSPEEREAVDDALERVAQAVSCLLTDGIDTTMNRFN
jgi:PTH1 family peptidyl-tRNA hydrolase